MNTVLLPAFTPPLDTPVGKERPTAQLVGVTLKNGGYSFDFSLMERYIRIMLKCGIKYFEHSHLFTPVSYTHLDVYKRQALARANGYAVLAFMHEPISTENASDTNITAIRKDEDVYKRQPLNIT